MPERDGLRLIGPVLTQAQIAGPVVPTVDTNLQRRPLQQAIGTDYFVYKDIRW